MKQSLMAKLRMQLDDEEYPAAIRTAVNLVNLDDRTPTAPQNLLNVALQAALSQISPHLEQVPKRHDPEQGLGDEREERHGVGAGHENEHCRQREGDDGAERLPAQQPHFIFSINRE